MPSDLHHLTVFVVDVDRSLHLYRDILGFEIIWRKDKVGGRNFSALIGVPDIEIELVYLQSRTGGIAIELTRMIRPFLKEIAGGINGLGITGICLTVENLENIHQRLTEEGWKPFTPCVDLTPPDGGPVRGFCFRTDEGMNVELIELSKEA